jgi:hypothetical protein
MNQKSAPSDAWGFFLRNSIRRMACEHREIQRLYSSFSDRNGTQRRSQGAEQFAVGFAAEWSEGS